MLRTRSAVVALFLLALSAIAMLPGQAGAAPCDDGGSDAAAIAAARAAVAAQCDCDGAASHGAYVACSRQLLASLVADGALPRSCRGTVQRCAARSTCGRPGAVTCCRTKRSGVTNGSIKRDAAACRAPQGGSACVGDYPSLCDACDATGCVPPCGNGNVDPGEECEPPDTATCDAACQRVAVCGDGNVDAGEQCEPPGTATCDATCQRIAVCGDGFVDGTEACDGSPSAECAPSSVCGAPGDAFACQCCSSGTSVFFDVYAEPYSPAPCCADGDFCQVYAPHFCSCD